MSKKILITLDDDQIAWLDDFRFARRFESRSAAIRWLLDQAKADKPLQRAPFRWNIDDPDFEKKLEAYQRAEEDVRLDGNPPGTMARELGEGTDTEIESQ